VSLLCEPSLKLDSLSVELSLLDVSVPLALTLLDVSVPLALTPPDFTLPLALSASDAPLPSLAEPLLPELRLRAPVAEQPDTTIAASKTIAKMRMRTCSLFQRRSTQASPGAI
jgi:hypothetical protein